MSFEILNVFRYPQNAPIKHIFETILSLEVIWQLKFVMLKGIFLVLGLFLFFWTG